MLDTGAASTSTEHVSLYSTPSTVMVAVIVAAPAATALTVPSSTVATPVLLELQVIEAPAGTVLALIAAVSPSTICSVLGVRATRGLQARLHQGR